MCTRKLLLVLSIATAFLAAVALPQGFAYAVSDKTKKEINTKLDKTAEQLARLLSNPAFRKFLSDETQASKNAEKILVLDKTLTKARGRPDLGLPPGILKKLLETVEGTKMKMKDARYNAKLIGIDLYFPVENHRKKWRGEEKLLVAFAPLDDDEKDAPITAYRAKTAERIALDPNNPPETPVLVIATEEHRTHQITTEPTAKAITASEPSVVSSYDPVEIRRSNSALGTMAKHNSYFLIKSMTIYNDHEPWIRGYPEIYVMFGHLKGSCVAKRVDLPDVNKERQAYTTSALKFYYDTNYSDTNYTRVMEEDGGSDGVYEQNVGGVVCRWNKESGDDYVEEETYYKKDVDWDPKETSQNWGDVSVYLSNKP